MIINVHCMHVIAGYIHVIIREKVREGHLKLKAMVGLTYYQSLLGGQSARLQVTSPGVI